MMEKMEAAVEDLKDVPVLLGWYLWDEPTVREYCGGDNLTQSSLKPSYIKVKLKAGDACLLQVKNLLIEV